MSRTLDPDGNPGRLAAPITLGSLRLRNRIAHAAVTTRYAEQGRVTPRLIAYHAARARGGAALLVTEPMNLLPSQGAPHKVRAHDAANFAGLESWAAAVRREGSHLVAQLQDPGRGRLLIGTEVEAIAPSAIPDDLSGVLPRALATDEVGALVQGFAAAACRLRDLGFAGVEVSAGHGHLIHQFLAARSNVRKDRYGGTLEDRARFLTELCSALRAACGPAFLIGVKLPGEDAMPGGIDLDAAAAITRLVHATGVVDYLTWCWGGHSRSLHLHLPGHEGGPMPYAQRIASLARQAPGIPVAALGLIATPSDAERCLRDGLADFVQVGRPFVADADWGRKAIALLDGARADGPRPCIACNRCWGRIAAGEALACTVNPALGEGREGAPGATPAPPSSTLPPRRVVVVGAGPAGLAAACAAAELRHAVTLFGAGERPARRLRQGAILPGGAALATLAEHLERRAREAGVEYRGGTAAGIADILGLTPDEVWLACGDAPGLRERWSEALQSADAGAGGLMVIDEAGTASAPAIALHATALGHRVEIATTAPSLAAAEPLVERQRWTERCAGRGIGLRLAVPRAVLDAAKAVPPPGVGRVLVVQAPGAVPAADEALETALRAAAGAGRIALRRVYDRRTTGSLADALAAGESCGLTSGVASGVSSPG